MALERLLPTEEVADMLGVSIYTVWRWIKEGKLRAFRPGREYRIPESAIEELLERSLTHGPETQKGRAS